MSMAARLNVREDKFDPNLGAGGKTKKKEKKGFKSDRYEKYKAQFDKNTRKKLKDQEAQKGKAVKEIKFDATAREDWLTSRHKEKNERRVNARLDGLKKLKRENAKFKREQREEARQQYNSYARVPILPDFSYKVPKYVDSMGRPVDPTTGELNEDDDGVPDWGGAAEGADDDDDDNDEDAAPEEKKKGKKAQKKKKAHVLDESSFYEDNDAKMGEGVRVDVRPLIQPKKEVMRLPQQKMVNGKKRGPRGGGLDFSDLPPAVAAELEKLQASQTKGAAQPKQKVHMLREMAKINQIKKTQRKGHGKKSKSGKKSHR